jgi:lincosamide nucleotidyltransferase A/C/D/E
MNKEDWLPVRASVLYARRREINLHPLTFDAAGNATLANFGSLPPFRYRADDFTTGMIDGRAVGCISLRLQLQFHTGYELDDNGRQDVSVLSDLQARPGAP